MQKQQRWGLHRLTQREPAENVPRISASIFTERKNLDIMFQLLKYTEKGDTDYGSHRIRRV